MLLTATAPPAVAMSLDALVEDIRACRACAGVLPHAPRPVVRVSATARILIAGQAPGRRVHESGLPFDDPSGDRLRAWMGVTRETFYDSSRIAVAAMGFCYPGTVNGADLPPRPECAPLWRARLLALMPEIRLTFLVGGYAHRYHLGEAGQGRMQDVVRAWRSHAPAVFALPHPSWRNSGWLKRNPWFEAEVVPALRVQVQRSLSP